MGISEIGMGRCVEVGLLVALCLATRAFASVHHLDADNNVEPIGAAKAVDDALATDREGTGHSGAVVLQSTATAKHGAKYSAKENHQKHVAWAKGLNEGKHGGIAKYGIAAKDFKNPQDPQTAAVAKQKAEAKEAAARKKDKAEAAAADKAEQEKKAKSKNDEKQAKEKQQAAEAATKEKSAAAVAQAKDDAQADVKKAATKKATKRDDMESRVAKLEKEHTKVISSLPAQTGEDEKVKKAEKKVKKAQASVKKAAEKAKQAKQKADRTAAKNEAATAQPPQSGKGPGAPTNPQSQKGPADGGTGSPSSASKGAPVAQMSKADKGPADGGQGSPAAAQKTKPKELGEQVSDKENGEWVADDTSEWDNFGESDEDSADNVVQLSDRDTNDADLLEKHDKEATGESGEVAETTQENEDEEEETDDMGESDQEDENEEEDHDDEDDDEDDDEAESIMVGEAESDEEDENDNYEHNEEDAEEVVNSDSQWDHKFW